MRLVTIGAYLALYAGCEREASSDAMPDGKSTAQSSSAPVVRGIHFDDGAAKTGIDFVHVATRTEQRLMPEILGAGVIIADFNRDGAADVFLVNSGSISEKRRPPSARDRLYINDGKGRFTDRTDAWNLTSSGYGMGAAVGDYDNDGWTDVYLTNYLGGDRLLRNTGSGFVDVTEQAGIDPGRSWTTSAAFFDLDNDGDLDIYVVRYVDYTPETAINCYGFDLPTYCTPVMYNASPDRLLRNNGDGTFTEISDQLPGAKSAGKGLAVVAADIDLDGNTDLYVANDTTPNMLLMNDGKGGLIDEAALRGVAYSETGVEEAGMGVDVTDVDNDGRPDIVCTNFQSETIAVYVQSSPLFFREVSDHAGIGHSARAHLGFGVDFFDADNDGDEDLLVCNGHVEDRIELYSESVTFAQPNSLYESLGAGKFKDASESAGDVLARREVSRGLATGDLDGDGDVDIIVANNDGPVRVGLNDTNPKGNFVMLWLEGRRCNRSAIGARIEARIGERTLTRQVVGGGSYLSACDRRIHLGLADATAIDQLIIHWPSGQTQTIGALTADSFYHVVEGADPEAFVPGGQIIAP